MWQLIVHSTYLQASNDNKQSQSAHAAALTTEAAHACELAVLQWFRKNGICQAHSSGFYHTLITDELSRLLLSVTTGELGDIFHFSSLRDHLPVATKDVERKTATNKVLNSVRDMTWRGVRTQVPIEYVFICETL